MPRSSIRRSRAREKPSSVRFSSSFQFGSVKKGSVIPVKVSFTNPGKTALRIYKVETGADKMEIHCPATVPAGGKATLTGNITASKADPDKVFILTLVTNSPDRPLVTVFVSGSVTD